jgi:hypothetical protein
VNPVNAKPEKSVERKSDAGGHDAPVMLRELDDLQRWPVARAIHRVIRTSPTGWATRIGLYGRWGTGKTTVLNFLERLETADKSLVVRFSAWSAVGEAGVVSQFYQELVQALDKISVKGPGLSRIKRLAETWSGWIEKGAELVGDVTDLKAPGSKEVIRVGAGQAIAKLRIDVNDIRALVAEAGKKGVARFVVFIDDLDRADPMILPKTLLALREMLDWPDFTFVLAFDKDVITSALGDYSTAFGNSADRFLEKIIDVPFVLPTPNAAGVSRLARRALESCCAFIPYDERERMLDWFPTNPRSAKLVARSLGALRDVAGRHDPGELDWFAIFLQTTLRTLAPRVAEELERTLIGVEARMRGDLDSEATDKHKPSAVIAELINKLLPASFERDDIVRLGRLAEAVYGARDSQLDEKIKYEMDLLVDEPAFTWKEFRAFLDAFADSPNDESLRATLKGAVERSGKDYGEAVADLLKSLRQGYLGLLSQLADDSELGVFNARAAGAKKYLSCAEFIFIKSRHSEIISAVRGAGECCELLGTFLQWRHFRRNEEDRVLRGRELSLAVAAARNCSEPLKMFVATDPIGRSGFPDTAERTKARRSWLKSVRDELEGRVVAIALGWFQVSGGIVSALDLESHEGIAKWLLENPESPMFTKKANTTKMANLFDSASRFSGTAAAAVLRENAREYLDLLLEGRGGVSWLDPGQRASFIKSRSKLIISVWKCIVSVEHQFRSHGNLREIRSKLIENGMGETKLKFPVWLKDRDKTGHS